MKKIYQINLFDNEALTLKNNIIYIPKIESQLNITNNKNLNLEDNRIILTDGIYVNKNRIDWTLRNTDKYKELYEYNYKERDVLRREIKIGEKMRQFILYSQINGFVPTIRIYAYFSSFSTIRQFYEKDDLSQLELEENALLKKCVELGFKVKVIVSLQVELIMRQGYSIEQYEERSKDLMNTINFFNTRQYKNIQIVIDQYQSHDSILIFDTILMIKSDYLQFDGGNFKYTLFESDKTILQNEIFEFDKKFDELYFYNHTSKSSLKIETDFDYIKHVAEIKKNRYLGPKDT